MNLQKAILEQLNYRINQEEISSRLYKSMAVFLETQGYLGAAKLFKKYSNEESAHADFTYDYMASFSILPSMKDIPTTMQGKGDFKDLANVIKLALQHEVEITNQCNKFAKICLDNNDLTTFVLAQKYCSEQIEEMNKMNNWMDKLTLFGTSEVAMKMLDCEMGEAA